ncbi:hypothetical protein HIM_08524 [Hirsutella minnesotensis 3608]|uniref:Rhodopsin domain-containing protein n=1 Tax=Hirsutella minnesotensis 3608 TaxID=1043627 RepID=A0A0F8A3M1_9HYPO|nr:hypothetical protein HIM_08524 [Hirsutella minnesotensis 3608]
MPSTVPQTTEADRGRANLLALSIVLFGLSLIVVTLRFGARRRQKVPKKADDYLVLPALVSHPSSKTVDLDRSKISIEPSVNNTDRPPSWVAASAFGTSQMGLTLMSIISLGCTKASILFFYQRIFCVASRTAIYSITISVSIGLVLVWMVAMEIFTAFQCHIHFNAIWDGTQLKYCDLSYPAMEGLAISDFLLDIWVLILPIYPVCEPNSPPSLHLLNSLSLLKYLFSITKKLATHQIMKLHTTTSRKISIAAIFLLACVGVAASIARMVIIIKMVQTGLKKIHTSGDPVQNQSRIMFYWILEMGISLVAVNLPSIWMVFSSVAPEAILRSIRSVISLVSIGSIGSKQSRDIDQEQLKLNKTPSSIAPITGPTADLEVRAISRGHRQGHDVPAGKIHVERSVQRDSVQQHEDAV